MTYVIFKIGNDGTRDFVEQVLTLDAAQARVRELAEAWPGEYAIVERAPDRSEIKGMR